MNLNPKIEFMEDLLSKQIERFERNRLENKRKAFSFRVIIVSCSAIITVLLGIRVELQDSDQYLKNIALILSSFITAITLIESFFDNRSLWVRYTNTANELKSLKNRLLFLKTNSIDAINQDDINKIFEKYENIMQETNEHWYQLKKESKSHIITK